jgi:rhodanese-related sulfurtransferase
VSESIGLDRLRKLLADGAQLVEVLPSNEFDDEHLPGAINIPLKALAAATVGVLDRSRPVVVYCWDALCDMSPRAASRLDALGFMQVYDFVDGKSFWLGSGLPTEGLTSDTLRAGDAADRTAPTCLYTDLVGAAARTLAESGADDCVVIDERHIVVGRVRRDDVEGDQGQRVEEVMEPGPTTIRPDTPLDKIMQRMAQRNTASVIVTRPTGEFIGVLRRNP